MRESPNGVVSIARIRPSLFSEEERKIVQAYLSDHPRSSGYELYHKPDRMVIYERITPGYEDLQGLFRVLGVEDTEDSRQKFMENAELTAKYEEVLQFTMIDPEDHLIHVERMCYLGGIDGWYFLDGSSDIRELAQMTIPLLGTDEFFDLI